MWHFWISTGPAHCPLTIQPLAPKLTLKPDTPGFKSTLRSILAEPFSSCVPWGQSHRRGDDTAFLTARAEGGASREGSCGCGLCCLPRYKCAVFTGFGINCAGFHFLYNGLVFKFLRVWCGRLAPRPGFCTPQPFLPPCPYPTPPTPPCAHCAGGAGAL